MKRKSTASGRKSTGGRKSTAAGRKSTTGKKITPVGSKGKKSVNSKKLSNVSESEDVFCPPWPVWDDVTLCGLKWNLVPNTENLAKIDRAAVEAEMNAATRKRAAKGNVRESLANGRNKARKSQVSRKSRSGRKSQTGRKSTSGRKSQSARKSATGRKSQASRKSTTGRNSKAAKKSQTAIKSKAPSGFRKTITRLSKVNDKKTVDEDNEDILNFHDPAGHGVLPPTIKPFMWRRPSWINDLPPTLDDEEEPLDLYTNNQHLLPYKVMRLLISSLMCLERNAAIHNFYIDHQDAQYTSNIDGYWKPWHHVYGQTKAGAGSEHKSNWNPYGLYFVRLFYMGKWRRVAIDEYFPYDSSGNLLLPSSSNPRNIWMPLLTKALFKVASLSWMSWDDSFEFDPISLLTGWIHIEIDVRSMTEDTIWKIIQSNVIHRPNLQSTPCVPVDHNHCIHESKDIFMDEPGSRFVYVETSETYEKTDKCPLDPRYQHLGFITMADNDTVPDTLPKWKTYRWVDWAIKNGYIRGPPGNVRRIIEFFFPLKKFKPITECKNIESDRDTMKGVKTFKYDTFYFETVYKCLEKLHIFYIEPYFKFSRCLNNIAKEVGAVTIKGLEASETKTGSVAGVLKPKSETTIKRMNVVGDCFYVWSDTLFCKNFIFSLHVLNVNRQMPAGFIVCEGWKWSLEAEGPIWFSLRTYSSKSQAINLGPGMQMMRIWYSIPQPYYFTIHSQSPFLLCVREHITNLAALESASLFFYGEEMAAAYSNLIKSEPGSVKHAEQLAIFTTAMCPPFIMCSSIPGPIEPDSIIPVKKIMQLFEEKAMGMVFDFVHKAEVAKIARIVSGFQQSFLDRKFGESYLEKNGYTTILNAVLNIRTEIMDNFYLGRINSIREADGFQAFSHLPMNDEEDEISDQRLNQKKKVAKTSGASKASKGSGKSRTPRASNASKSSRASKVSKKSARKSTASRASSVARKSKLRGKSVASSSSQKRSANIHGGYKGKAVSKEIVYNQFLLENPVHNANLLRKMTENRAELLKQYPFKYDDTFRLTYFNFASVTEMKYYPTKWVLIGRVVINIHSTTPIPVGFFLFTETKPINMVLYDMDNNDIVPLGLDSNFTYYISRNVAGYCLLLHGYPPVDVREKSAQWLVRAYGANIPDVPHVCSLSPPWGWGGMCGPTERNIDDTVAPGEFKMKEEIEKKNLATNGERWGYCSGLKGPNPILVMTNITGNYFPNPDGVICKFLVFVNSEILPPAALITLCFHSSKTTSKVSMKLKGKHGKIVQEVSGVGMCLLPAAYLTVEGGQCDERITPLDDEVTKSQQEVFYVGNIWVVDNTWPVTQKEMNVLEQIRNEPSEHDGTKAARMVTQGAPNWKLIMVVDNEQRNSVRLEYDMRTTEGLKNIKEKMWDVIDPERLAKGCRLRDEFFTQLALNRGELVEEEEPIDEETVIQNDQITYEEEKGNEKPLKRSKESTNMSVAYTELSVNMGTDYVDKPYFSSKVMQNLYERFKNPNEIPNQFPKVIHIEPFKTNAPARLGPYDEFLDFVPTDEVGNIYTDEGVVNEMEEEESEDDPKMVNLDKFSLDLPSMYMDQEIEQAQKDIKEYSDKNIEKMYNIRAEVISYLQKKMNE